MNVPTGIISSGKNQQDFQHVYRNFVFALGNERASEAGMERILQQRGFGMGYLNQKVAGWWFGTFFIFPYIGLLIIPID